MEKKIACIFNETVRWQKFEPNASDTKSIFFLLSFFPCFCIISEITKSIVTITISYLPGTVARLIFILFVFAIIFLTVMENISRNEASNWLKMYVVFFSRIYLSLFPFSRGGKEYKPLGSRFFSSYIYFFDGMKFQNLEFLNANDLLSLPFCFSFPK